MTIALKPKETVRVMIRLLSENTLKKVSKNNIIF